MATLESRYKSASPTAREAINEILAADADDQAWVEQLGPALSGTAVARMLGVTPQAVSSNKKLLRLAMRSGRVGYPIFQFTGPSQVEGLGEIVRLLTPVTASSWTIASWLTSPNPELGGNTPIKILRSTRGRESVMSAAQRFALALSR